MMLNRYYVFGFYLLELEDLRNVNAITFPQFARTS